MKAIRRYRINLKSREMKVRMPRGTEILCVTSERIGDSMGLFIHAAVPVLTTAQEITNSQERRFELLMGDGEQLEDRGRRFIGTTKHMGGAVRVYLFEVE